MQKLNISTSSLSQSERTFTYVRPAACCVLPGNSLTHLLFVLLFSVENMTTKECAQLKKDDDLKAAIHDIHNNHIHNIHSACRPTCAVIHLLVQAAFPPLRNPGKGKDTRRGDEAQNHRRVSSLLMINQWPWRLLTSNGL